jgi:3-methyladenine DNA glycosylase AlkD
MSLQEIRSALRQNANDDYADSLRAYFKTGKGEYAEGDKFLGVKVPVQRRIAEKFKSLSLRDCLELLHSEWHEERFLALAIMTLRFQKSDAAEQEKIAKLYVKHRRYVNHWDLVDASAPHILGAYLFRRDKDILYELARAKSLWERRIAILSCFYFIRQNAFDDALNISEMLLDDPRDLIHKAVGWMLREIGSRRKETETGFLNVHLRKMPRVMLRYAIEKFPEEERKAWLKKA